ncbi:MAG: thioredoxin family protein [Flavobacteriaceae bacterium]|nr:thioredoxin family protein [Flavobacteriaceae bacterium]
MLKIKKISFFVCLFLLANCFGQQAITATKDASGNLIGIATKASFNQQPFVGWFTSYYDTYVVDVETLSQLEKALRKVKIKAFMGTWCGDSKREIPRFYKILEAVNFDLKNLEMITVNRRKRTPDNLQEGFDIIRVPTFIFYKKGKEIGRYVEYARESLEKDMLKILTGKPYKHSYEN